MQLLRQGLGRLGQFWGSAGSTRAGLRVWLLWCGREGRGSSGSFSFLLTEPPVGSSVRKMD